MEKFEIGNVVQHFKRETLTKTELEENPNMYLYEILGEATHTETKEKLIAYKALYGKNEIFVRPYDMFFSKVDKDKYPYIEQEYRLELADTYHNLYKVLEQSIGEWCAFYNEHKEIRHAKIIKIGHIKQSLYLNKCTYFLGKKKNGEKIYIDCDKFIGFCSKPTKTNKNPKIYEYSINKYLKLRKINEEVLKLAKECEQTNSCPDFYYQDLMKLWTNDKPGTRVPEYFEELIVPQIFKEIFDDIFIDF